MTDVSTHSKELQFDPLLVDIHPNGSVLTNDESVAMWMNLRDVSEETYQLLYSPVVADAMLKMQETLQLSDDIVMRTASLVRMLYFKKTTLEDFPNLLKNEVGLPQEKIAVTMNFIKTEILSLKAPKKIEEETNVTSKAKTIPLQLLQALEKFPRINDQQVTGNRLKIRSEKEAVRGSVRNWLRSYRDSVGARKHSAIERGQFLFQSENTKKLSFQEREKVSIILKSFDENETLAVNTDKQEIVFPVMASPQQTSSQPQVPILSQPSQSFQIKQQMKAPLMKTPISSVATPVQSTHSQPEAMRTSIIPDSKIVQQFSHTNPFVSNTPIVPVTTGKTFNFSKAMPITSPTTPIGFSPAHPFTPNPFNQSEQTSAVYTIKDAKTPLESDSFHFSSGQVLPAEKQTNQKMSSEKPQSNRAPISPIVQPKSIPRASSFGLGYNNGTPVTSRKKEVWGIPSALQNVVDLRSNENE
jgi:hypothetical protein